jgi:hypothetical protein
MIKLTITLLALSVATATTAVAAATNHKRVVSHLRENSQACESLAHSYNTSTDGWATYFYRMGQAALPLPNLKHP